MFYSPEIMCPGECLLGGSTAHTWPKISLTICMISLCQQCQFLKYTGDLSRATGQQTRLDVRTTRWASMASSKHWLLSDTGLSSDQNRTTVVQTV